MSRRWFEDPVVWGTAALFVGGYFYFGQPTPQAIVGGVKDVFTKGSRLTYGVMDSRGIVITSPDALLNALETRLGYVVDQDVQALARMIRSEGAAEGNARAHVALNDLARLQMASLFDLLTYSTASWSRGWFGKQASFKYRAKDGGETWNRADAAVDSEGHFTILDKQVRRYSTAQDPYDGDIATARQAIAEHAAGIDPTGGAVKFLDKSGLRAQEGAGSYAGILAKWGEEGLVAFTLPELGDDFVLFRRA